MSSSAIPKIFHRIWMVMNPAKPDLPQIYKEFDLELKRLHPNWQIMEWNDENIPLFIAEYYPEFLPVYLSYDVMIKRHDASRYLIVNHFGGVFIQHSIKLQKNIEDLLGDADILFAISGRNNDQINNGFFASIPNHSFWKNLITDLHLEAHYHVFYATGPRLLTAHVLNYLKNNITDITILGREVIFPFDWDEKNDPIIKAKCILDHSKCTELYPDAYGYCIWVGSWIENRPDLIKEIENAREQQLNSVSDISSLGQNDSQEEY